MELNNKNLWPFNFPPRKSQIKALNWLEEQKVKYLVLEAPTGTGKSNIGVAFSKYLSNRNSKGDAYILTPQRVLQKQYEQSFINDNAISITSLYGKSNYKCNSKNTSCDVGSLVKPRCNNCAHTIAKNKAKKTPNVVMNYKLGLLLFAYGKATFTQRKLLILDECHTLEKHLVDFDAITISERRSLKFNIKWKVAKDFNEAIVWCEDPYLKKARDYLIKLGKEIEPLLEKDGNNLTKSQIRKLQEYNNIQEHVDELEMFILQAKNDKNFDTKWVYTKDKSVMAFKRLTGSYTFKRLIDPMADQILFMSSTILNKEGFCRDLGIDPSQTAFLSLTSDFPVENRPIFYMPQMKMNASWNNTERSEERKKIINKIVNILQKHENDSGIIHTGNFAIASWITTELKDRITQKIFHHNPDSGDDRNSVIAAFQNSPKTSVLISPSSTEGLDLKDDLGRFSIFAKVPFGYLGDAWIKRRMQMSSEWYSRQALIDIIQGGGRVVRHENDWGCVYILDESFGYLFYNTRSFIPQWWKDSYQVIAR